MTKFSYYGLSRNILTLCIKNTHKKTLKSKQNQLESFVSKIGWASLCDNQINSIYSLFVMLKKQYIKANKWSGYKKLKNSQFTFYVNPSIKDYSLEKVQQWQMCPSYPGLRMLIQRPTSIKVQYENSKLIEFGQEMDGFQARLFQHQYDHIFGNDLLRKSLRVQVIDQRLKQQNQQKIDHLLDKFHKQKLEGQQYKDPNFRKLKQLITYSIIDYQKNDRKT